MDPLVKAVAGYHVTEIQAEQASLEDVFLAYYSSEATDGSAMSPP
jgi:hypothetical protein